MGGGGKRERDLGGGGGGGFTEALRFTLLWKESGCSLQ